MTPDQIEGIKHDYLHNQTNRIRLEIGKTYRYRDFNYGKERLIECKGKLIQVTDYFAVFDNGRYKTSVYFENVGGIA